MLHIFNTDNCRHPFAGQSNVSDVLLRMNHTMHGSEQGRKVISTFTNTGKLVAETGHRFKSWMRGITSSTSNVGSGVSSSPTNTNFDDLSGRTQ